MLILAHIHFKLSHRKARFPIILNQNIHKTDVGRRQTLGHPRSINPNMINYVPQKSPHFLKSYMLSVHEAIKISYSYHLPCQGSRNCQNQMSVTTHLLTWFGRLSNTAHPYSKSISIIKMYSTNNLIPNPLKLSNSQRSYPIWQMSILMFAWWVSDNQVKLHSDAFLNSYGGWHAITL